MINRKKKHSDREMGSGENKKTVVVVDSSMTKTSGVLLMKLDMYSTSCL